SSSPPPYLPRVADRGGRGRVRYAQQHSSDEPDPRPGPKDVRDAGWTGRPPEDDDDEEEDGAPLLAEEDGADLASGLPSIVTGECCFVTPDVSFTSLPFPVTDARVCLRLSLLRQHHPCLARYGAHLDCHGHLNFWFLAPAGLQPLNSILFSTLSAGEEPRRGHTLRVAVGSRLQVHVAGDESSAADATRTTAAGREVPSQKMTLGLPPARAGCRSRRVISRTVQSCSGQMIDPTARNRAPATDGAIERAPADEGPGPGKCVRNSVRTQ
ncbi:hypothetical protein THAOC_26343, partial [Thalassiosira oceanica]